MENPQTTSEFMYEDEFSYVTETGDIYRKEDSRFPAQKVGETDAESMESDLAECRSNFVQIEKKIGSQGDEITEEQKQKWEDKLREAEAIGDFDRLYRQIENLSSPDGNENTGAPAENSTEEQQKEDVDPIGFYKDLMKEARQIAAGDDWQDGEKKLDDLSHQWSEGPTVEGEEAEEKVRDLYYKFTKAEENFHERRTEHLEKSNKKRKENLSKKQDLLNQIEGLVQAQKWSAVNKIKQLQNRWRNIGPVPKEQAHDLHEKYQSLINEFKSHKVDRLVEKRQKREDNLMMKMTVLDKMDRVAEAIDHTTENWQEIDEKFSDLTRQWKKIGRVPREKSNNVWDRYKAAQDKYYDKKYRYHRDHRSKVDSFTAKKENVIEDAEALVEMDNLAKAARKVNKLHRRWKKIGNLPQRKEDELWDRFKSATDKFNEKKANNAELIRQQEEEHYQQKLKLIERAEQIKDTTDWKEGHNKMQSMMDQWKKIGPVPRKKSDKIWKQFKGAMDVFYDRRREHFKATKEQQKENLKKKKKILEKLRELGQHEDPIEAVNEAKKLQAEFKDIGYVPIEKKNEMWKKYREACDVIYDRMRAAKSGNKFDQELAKASLSAEQRAKIQELRK
ncbi:MAG TPA: DUF349 domain-containing protein, partial [Balneolaceae bacterium]|nr:DUF349 domain-containing protein [Balneolaceae bacterium]